MPQHSSDRDRGERTRVEDSREHAQRAPNIAALASRARDASCRRRGASAQHHSNLAPAVDPAQSDLAAHHKAEEQDQRGVFSRERALGLYAATEFLVEPLDDIGRTQGLPLRLRKREKRQQFGAALLQAAHDARTSLRPLALEGTVRRAASGRDDAPEARTSRS